MHAPAQELTPGTRVLWWRKSRGEELAPIEAVVVRYVPDKELAIVAYVKNGQLATGRAAEGVLDPYGASV
jgi:hypothetical protein